MRAFVFLIALFAAGPLHALSCLATDIATSFQRFAAAPERYVVVHGTFHFDEGALPKPPQHNPNLTTPNTPIPARFLGKSLSMDGFQNRFATDLVLNVKCLGPWCAAMTSGRDTIAFLRAEDGVYSLSINPCGGVAFADPTPAMIAQVTACMRGQDCDGKQALR
ncbi:hypothetical protein [Algirhabdus cladophorae]|uniref:hypothetical protein n=1 Tax=Algirhabdus cladophorae TaxID=3377108 RepID=UPI003B847A3C